MVVEKLEHFMPNSDWLVLPLETQSQPASYGWCYTVVKRLEKKGNKCHILTERERRNREREGLEDDTCWGKRAYLKHQPPGLNWVKNNLSACQCVSLSKCCLQCLRCLEWFSVISCWRVKNQACRFVGVGVCVVTIGTAREKDNVPQKRQTGSERLFVCGRQQFDMNEEKRSVCIVLWCHLRMRVKIIPY